MIKRLLSGKNPFSWNEIKERGMDVYHDIIDWLGGLPYEVASPEEVINFCESRNFKLLKIERRGEGANSIYLFKKCVQ